MIKQSRRKYIQEFREEALRLVTEQGYTSAKAAQNLGIDPSLLQNGKIRFKTGRQRVSVILPLCKKNYGGYEKRTSA